VGSPAGGDARLALAREVASRYAAHGEVLAVALGGSVGAGRAAAGSDIDLYLYLRSALSLGARTAIAERESTRAEIANAFWESGDEWVDRSTGIAVDVIIRDPRWIEDELDRVLARHEPSVGYSTCLWANVLGSVPLHDPDGWFRGPLDRARVPYPEPLRRAIVACNFPLLRDAMSGYRSQLAKAQARADLVSLNHRTAAYLASWFDVLFALDRVPHPGEKRLLELAEELCPRRPSGMQALVEALLAGSCAGAGADVVALTDDLTASLDVLVEDGLA